VVANSTNPMAGEKLIQPEQFMKKAFRLAERNRHLTGYDPAVGCVIVKAGRVIATGSHREVTTPHAEVIALKKAGRAARGADLYINLEPCAHWGNNPPCVEVIIKSGIKRVFAATGDPNPLVGGKGFRKLKQAGIRVIKGLLQKEARQLNEAFFKYIRKEVPFVTLKAAASLDGKIATSSGQSRWISGQSGRRHSHYLRSIHQAIMVGTGTVIKDNPELTVRLRRVKKQPLRVVLDAVGVIPLEAKVFNRKAPTLLFVSDEYPFSKIGRLKKKGVAVENLPVRKGRFDLGRILQILGKKRIASLLVEGGANLFGSFVEKNLADKVIIFLAPVIIGGRHSLAAVAGRDIKFLKEAYQLKNLSYQKIGRDLVVEGYFVKKPAGLKTSLSKN